MGKGGYREGAGRPLGSLGKITLERRKVEKAIHQSIMAKANRLLKIMMNQAEGEYFLFRIDETENKKGKKIREHVMVTDWREIKKFFDQHGDEIESMDDLDGLSGMVTDKSTEVINDTIEIKQEKKYYYIKTSAADWRAIESLFDRVFGKSTQHISTDDGDNEEDNYEQLNGEQIDRHIEKLRGRIAEATGAKGEKKEDSNLSGSEEQTKTE